MAADTRERILASCARVIARTGLARFRMSEVAREAGVSIGLLAYHFGDRDGLLQAALDEVTAGAVRRSAPDTAIPDPDPAQRLERFLCAEFGDAADIREGSIVWNELRAAAVFDPERARQLAASTTDWQLRVVELIRAAEPALTREDAEARALSLTALVEGLSGRWLTGQLTAAEAQSAVRAALRD